VVDDHAIQARRFPSTASSSHARVGLGCIAEGQLSEMRDARATSVDESTFRLEVLLEFSL
jgi:hypothetical protein